MEAAGAEPNYDAQAPVRDWSKVLNSVRNFESWLGGVVPGLSDVDAICERRGRFLVLEGKEVHGGRLAIAMGQFICLRALTNLPEFTVLVVGEDGAWRWTADVRDLGGGGTRTRQGMVFYPANDNRFKRLNNEQLRERVRKWWDE